MYLRFMGVTGSEVAADTDFERGADRLGLPFVPKSFAPWREQPFFVLSQRIQQLGLGLLESRSQATLASRHRVHYKKGVSKGVEKEKKREKKGHTEGVLVATDGSTEDVDSGGRSLESATAIMASLRPAARKKREISCNLNEGDGKLSRISAVTARSSISAAPQSMSGFLEIWSRRPSR